MNLGLFILLLHIQPSSSNNALTIVADYPHLLIEQNQSNRTRLEKRLVSRLRPPKREIFYAQRIGLRSIKHKLEQPNNPLYRAFRYTKSDPPPTTEILTRLADSIKHTIRLLGGPQLADPYDLESLDVSIVVYNAWRGGWCTGTPTKDDSGQWYIEPPVGQKHNFLVAPVHATTHTIESEEDPHERLKKRLLKRLRNEQPLWRSWFASFRNAQTGLALNRKEHSHLLSLWWQHRERALKQLILQNLDRQYRPRSINIEYRVYDPLTVLELLTKKIKDEDQSTIWLSQSLVRPDWAPNLSPPLIVSQHKRHNLSRKLAIIANNSGTWSSDEQTYFCEKATDLKKFSRLFRRKINEYERIEMREFHYENPYPKGLLTAAPIKAETGLREEQEEWNEIAREKYERKLHYKTRR